MAPALGRRRRDRLSRALLGVGVGVVLGASASCVGAPDVEARPHGGQRHGAAASPEVSRMPGFRGQITPRLHIIAPTVLELRLVSEDILHLGEPTSAEIDVSVNGRRGRVLGLGVRRRVQWAALRTDTVRIGTSLFLRLERQVRHGDSVVVTHAATRFADTRVWQARVDDDRISPVLHVSQVGYLPALPKHAFIGLYLGTAGELPLDGLDTFTIEGLDGRVYIDDHLRRRPDRGMPGALPAYQQVRLADFSALDRPGVYRLRVPGLGVSPAFRIGDGVASTYARTYALGLYHQRCGAPNRLPYTRFTHGACHFLPAGIPQPGEAASVDARLERSTVAAVDRTDHPAPRLRRLRDALYPPVRRGTLDVRGGHHDAGDYGKYTINSAQFIHHLVFTADTFPAVRRLDNLGIPESGDGVGDLLQIAHWETEFLARMQDDDGGFFFLVHPRDRAYEHDVLPDQGDRQVVFPKNTSATAAAVAALAQASSSPAFRQAFATDARRYLEAARLGWQFLLRAWADHGRPGAYQMVTHYGDVFADRDEIVWAATEIFLATGNEDAHRIVRQEFDPLSPEVRRWGWWALFEGFGAAARSYAFASVSSRASVPALDPVHAVACRQAIETWGSDIAAATRDSAYGTGYPHPSKRGLLAGWYFSENNVFDLLVARRLAGTPDFDRSIAENLSYLSGANPVNVSYVTGLGTRSPTEVVSQYAQNDRRALPPTGIPVGNLQQGLPVRPPHGRRLVEVTIPSDQDAIAPYPIYDRWSDVFNTMLEATIVDQARALAASAILMAETSLAEQRYTYLEARITGLPDITTVGEDHVLSVSVADLDPPPLDIVWEWSVEPRRGAMATVSFAAPGTAWVEAELVWMDGRRAFAVASVDVQ